VAPVDDQALLTLMRAIVVRDRPEVLASLDATPALATASLVQGATRQHAVEFMLPTIGHYVYAGDTVLHVAAVTYQPGLVDDLAAAGADVDAENRRGAHPLHYAVDGNPGSARWDPIAQRDTVAALLRRGADANAADANGTPALLRAIRNRCASAVAALLDGGADPNLTNGRGSTARQLATKTTGRGGSGSEEAKAQQLEILELLDAAGAA
jgi:hypothetical protein